MPVEPSGERTTRFTGSVALLAVAVSILILVEAGVSLAGWLGVVALWAALGLLWIAHRRSGAQAGRAESLRTANAELEATVAELQATVAAQKKSLAAAITAPDKQKLAETPPAKVTKTATETPTAAARKVAMVPEDASPEKAPATAEEDAGEVSEQLAGTSAPSWRELVRKLPVDLYTVDADAVVLYAHQIPNHGFNLRVGSLLTDIVRLDHADGLRQALASCLATGERQSIEWPGNARADGSDRWLAVELVSLEEAETDVPQALVLIQDITERRQIKEREKSGQRLESLGRLTSGVGHDFNNILTIIHCNALLLQETLPEEAGELDEILTAVDRASRLTHQLLAFSRATEVKAKVINLNETVENLLKMLSRLIGENIQLDFMPHDAPWRIRADVAQIDQVVMNLVVNARDAMPRGGRLAITTDNILLEQDLPHDHGVIDAGDYVTLEVTDTGEGISPEALARIFEPYFSTKATGQGYGLGLATVHSVLVNAGGGITCQSTLHVGTTFTVYLPVFAGEGSHVSSIEEPPLLDAANATILVVEDEDAVREVAVRILERHGYKVLSAPRGTDARRLCRDYPEQIDVLFTDVIMPDLNGPDLAQAVLAMRPDTRVLFTSGYTESITIEQGVIPTRIHFLSKPYTARDMLNKVMDVLLADTQTTRTVKDWIKDNSIPVADTQQGPTISE